MSQIKNYQFNCPELGLELHSKYRIRKYYFDKKEYMSENDLNVLMKRKAVGKFTYMGDTWTFKTVFVDKKQKVTERKSIDTITPKPYTKVVGRFVVTYSGTTHKPIMTSMYSPSNTII